MATTSSAALRRQPATRDTLDSLTSRGWTLAPDTAEPQGPQRLSRDFRFKDFSEAWGFMNRVALAAEKLNVRPHPCSKAVAHRVAHANDPACSTTRSGPTCTTASRSP